MPLDVSTWGAFVAGLLSFVSPCVLPLVPPYLCFLAGMSLDQLTGQQGGEAVVGRGGKVFTAALAFVLGFSTVFVALGASASAVGQMVSANLDVLGYIAGAVIIVLGLHFLGVARIPLLYREARMQVASAPASLLGSYVVGLAFAFGWTPCVGPVLATILLVAGSEGSAAKGAGLLFAYSLGIGLPFLAAAAFAGPFMTFMRRFSRHLGAVEKVMGGLLVLTGIAFLTGGMRWLSYWILETFPSIGQIG